MRPLSGQSGSIATHEGGSSPNIAGRRQTLRASTGSQSGAHAVGARVPTGSGVQGVTGNGRIAFYLFLLVNAVLFVRPAEIVPALEGAPIYEVVILSALAATASAVWKQVTLRNLSARPLTVCMFGLLAAVVFANLSHGALYEARTDSVGFAKIVLYYLLLVAVVNTPAKLRVFLGWLGGLILILTTLTLLQYHGAINVASLEAIQQREVDATTGESRVFPRLCGMGIFHDPNDLSVILVMGIMISLSRLGERGAARFFWLVPLAIMGYALSLTHSRGGLIALLFSLMALFVARFRGWKALLMAGAILPGIVLLLGGRQTNIDLSNQNDTSQQRIRLWRDGLVMLHRAPVFGIGTGKYEEEAGLVAHNSFIHAYTELGVFGGTLFLGAFVYPLGVLYRLGSRKGRVMHPTLHRLRPCVLASATGMVGGMLSLSRVYTLMPYVILGVVMVFLRLAGPAAPSLVPRSTPRVAFRLLVLGMLFLAGAEVFVRIFAGQG
jgi:putative inorganic carbon (hco3(-)) transporter